jgi:hypothetical protein
VAGLSGMEDAAGICDGYSAIASGITVMGACERMVVCACLVVGFFPPATFQNDIPFV